MTTKKKKTKLAYQLKVDDKIVVCGKTCVIRKTEMIHFILDNGGYRIELNVFRNNSIKERIVMFLPPVFEVEYL